MSVADGQSPPSAPRRRSTRDRPAKPPLSKDAVVDAALAILKSDGLEAVTMRRVASALDTGAASLYVYVPGREGLLQAMLDRITASIELEVPDSSRWREQLHSLLGRMHQALVAYPGVAPMTLAQQPVTLTEPVLVLFENLLGIVLAGGIEPQDAAWACDVLLLLVTGAASEDDARRAQGYSYDSFLQEVDTLHERFTSLPRERFPLIATHAAQLLQGDGDERFRFAVDVVIDGVLARATTRAE